MIVKFSCGCIGILDGDRLPLVVKPCDLNHPECWEPYTLYRRDMGDKTHEPLPPEEAEQHITEMARLIGEGYAFRQIRSLLKS